MSDLKRRISSLEQAERPRIDLADRMRLARERRRGKSPEQLKAESVVRREQILRWYESKTGTPAQSYWQAFRLLSQFVAKELFGK